MYDVLIVGAGTAGLTAAVYAARAGRSALLLERRYCGGQIVNAPEVENYPGIRRQAGYEFAENLRAQALDSGAELKLAEVTALTGGDGCWRAVTREAAFEGRTVILATGAEPRPLGLAREAEFAGRGVSYCAACDGALYRDRTVVVCGGGNTALSDALQLCEICRSVTLVHRRDALRGDARDAERLRARANVNICLNAVVTELSSLPPPEAVPVMERTAAPECLRSVTLRDVNTGETRRIPADGLFVAYGRQPDNAAFRDVVRLDEDGCIAAGEDCETGTPGIFAAGDCRRKRVRQLTTAAADGTIAALAACKWLE